MARVKLAALGGGSAVTTAMVWQGGWPSRSIASDQPLVVHGNSRTNDLMLLNLVTGETRNLTNLSPGTKEKFSDGVISADGKTVAYRWEFTSEGREEIRTIATDGTGLRTLYSGKMTPSIFPRALSPDKRTLLVSTGIEKSGSTPPHQTLQAMSLADGSLKPFADGFWGRQVSYSPDGKLVALAGRMGPAGAEGLFLANSDGTGVRPLLPEFVYTPCWAAEGKWIVFISARTGTAALWALPPTGGEPRLLKEVSDIQALIGLTRDGSLFYSSQSSVSDVQVARLDPTNFAVAGTPMPFLNTFVGRNEMLAFSPDGEWVAWRSTRGDYDYALVVRPTAGGEERVIYKNGGRLFCWLPDSQALLIHREGGFESVLDRVAVADGRVSELDGGIFAPGSLPVLTAPNGRTVLGARCDAVKGCDLARIDTQTKAETVEHLGDMVERGPMVLSADGKWLAILGKSPSNETVSIFVRPAAPGGKIVELVQGVEKVPGAYTFTFTPDSKAILYTVSVPAPQFHEFRVIPIEGGTPISIPLAGEFPSFHPDGRLAYTRSSDAVETWMVRNLPLK